MIGQSTHQILVGQISTELSSVTCSWEISSSGRALTISITGQVELPITQAMALASDLQTAIQETLCRHTPGPKQGIKRRR
jgi:hypothetical protein